MAAIMSTNENVPADKSYPIVGIQEGHGPKQGQVPVRREIDEWWFSRDLDDLNQHTLFIYALQTFQTRGYDKDDLSYFSIAGIHGLPLKPWPRSHEGTGFYCAHGKYTFPVWHTPYMMLYEQRLYEEMCALIPKTFDQKDHEEMYRAAQTWRLPYWDWAMRKPDWDDKDFESDQNSKPGVGPNVPFLLTQKKVMVRTREGKVVPVDNPMYNYAVPSGTTFGDHKVSSKKNPWVETCRVTSRHPKFPDDLNAEMWNNPNGGVTAEMRNAYAEGLQDDWKIITAQLRGPDGVVGDIDNASDGAKSTYYANSLPEAVKRLFRSTVDDDDNTPVMDYKNFSTNVYHYGQQVEAYPSLEAIHNNMHDFTGAFGYMGSPATSAFDPIFWLHHCNVDRLLSIWQELFTDTYKDWLALGDDGQDDPDKRDGPGVPNTKLAPFALNANNELYIAKTTSYKHSQFGYTYPELQPWAYDGREEYLQAIRERIDRLYTTTPTMALLLPENEEAAKQQMRMMTPANLQLENIPAPLLELAKTEVVKRSAQTVLRGIDDYNGATFGKANDRLSWKSEDYVANVLYERFALDGEPYTVTLFIGRVPEHNVYDFARDNTAVGAVYNFSSPVEGRGVDEGGCESCKSQKENGDLFTGQVILTDTLIQLLDESSLGGREKLASLNESDVVPYLQKNFDWRVTDSYGQDVPVEHMTQLKISVATAKATHYATPGHFSDYTPYRILYDVTAAKTTGLSPSDSAAVQPAST